MFFYEDYQNQMIEEMRNRNWNTEDVDTDSFEDVKDAYFDMISEYNTNYDSDSSDEEGLSYSLW